MKTIKVNELKFPFYVIWEVTNLCNSKCLYCYNNSGQKRKDELSQKFIKKICDELIINNVLRVTLVGGEPLLSPHFRYITNRLKDKTSLELITNGTLIKKRLYPLLMNYSRIQISLDGLNLDYYKLRGINKFKLLERNIDNLLKLQGPEIIISVTLSKMNLIKFERIINFCIKKNIGHIKVSEFIPLGRGYNKKLVLEPSREDYNKIKRIIKKYKRKCFFEWESKPQNKSSILPIKKNWIAINSQGDIMPDPFVPFSLGNIKKKNIKSFWRMGKNAIPLVKSL